MNDEIVIFFGETFLRQFYKGLWTLKQLIYQKFNLFLSFLNCFLTPTNCPPKSFSDSKSLTFLRNLDQKF